MRIIAGRLGGRTFTSPHGHRTHPMSDKIRGALFNALGDIDELIVLDAFAGSGALSFEAISRGARRAVAVDADRSAQRAILENIKALNLSSRVKLIKASASAWLSTTNDTFNLVLLDPPYDNLQPDLLRQLAERATQSGVIVFSLPPHAAIQLSPDFQIMTSKDYGDAQLLFYRRTS